MRTRISARAVVYDAGQNRILLVRNKNASFWYIPGGGWESERENILECAAREVKEETGLDVTIGKFLYLQEYHDSPEVIVFDSFWLASVDGSDILNEDHIDLDSNGAVEEARWFGKEEVLGLEVYPDVFRADFWDDVEKIVGSEDRFLGVESNQHDS